jgi:hypothetical protein
MTRPRALIAMNPERTEVYGRVIKTLEDVDEHVTVR